MNKTRTGSETNIDMSLVLFRRVWKSKINKEK